MASQKSSLHIRQALKNLGFSDNEIKITTFLFYEKKATAREVSHKTAISFSSVQYTLTNLSNRGIIICHPGKPEDTYEVCSEKDLVRWIEQQKEVNQEIYDKAKKDIHDFISIVEGSTWKPDVLYYEGKEGIIELYEDMLQTAEKADKNIYSWLDIEKIYEIFGDYLYEYIRKRMEKNIISNDILPKIGKNLQHSKKEENRNVKFAKDLKINGQVRIYGTKVAVITFHDKKPVGFVFEGKTIVKLFKSIFDGAWGNLA